MEIRIFQVKEKNQKQWSFPPSYKDYFLSSKSTWENPRVQGDLWVSSLQDVCNQAIIWYPSRVLGFPGGSDSRVCLQCKRPVCRPWVGKIHWRKEWLPTPVFFPGQFHGRWSLVDYSPWSFKESDTEWITNTHSRVSDWQEAKKCFTFTHAIPRIATWWCQMAYVCLFSTGKISRNFFFPFLYLQGYQGVFFSLLFINIFSQSLIHKKVLNGKSENLESVVNWGENKGERK